MSGGASKGLNQILDFIGRDPPRDRRMVCGPFVTMAWIVSRLVRYEPMISGSGIPQLEGEMVGKLNQRWQRVIPAKFFWWFSVPVGRSCTGEGKAPLFSLGAMAGKSGISGT